MPVASCVSRALARPILLGLAPGGGGAPHIRTCVWTPCSLSDTVAKHGKLEPRPGSVVYKAHVPQIICVVCQAAGVWRPSCVRELFGHRVSCAALVLDASYYRNWSQRAYICRRQQQRFEFAKYSNGMDSVRLSMIQSS